MATTASSPPSASPHKRVHTPTVLQLEAVECGAASLAMVMGHHGRIVPLVELRVACGISRDGSKALNIVKAARSYGLEAKGLKKTADELRGIAFPAILFWNNNHFVVLEGFQGDWVFLNDPAMGPRRIGHDEFKASFSGVVLTFSVGPEFKKGGKRPSTLRAIRERARGSEKSVAFVAACGFILVVPGLVVPVFSQIFVDDILVKGMNDWLRPLLVGMALAALLNAFVRYMQLRAINRLGTKIAVSTSGKMFWHLLRLPMNFYSQRFAGELQSRLSLADNVANILSGQVSSTFIDTFMMVFYVAIMFAYDWVLTCIGLVSAALNFAALRYFSRTQKDANMRLSVEYGKASGMAIAGLQQIETLKASGLENDFFSRWAGYWARAMNTQQQVGRQGQLLGAVPGLLAALTSASVLVVGGFRVMGGHMTIGMLVGFQALMGQFLAPVGRLVGFGSTIQKLSADVNRMDDILENESDPMLEPPEGPIAAPTLDNFRLSGRLELRDVSFGYSPLEPPLIENLNLVLTPGQRVALVGGSGSGKSTVAKLIAGLYSPRGGEILFDDRPLGSYSREVLANSLAMVDQDLFLISGTVRDNLTLWDPTLTDDQLIPACKDAAIHSIVAAMPGGYDSPLLEGAANLSGGQRQRLEIARALARRPAILILDEATSALDSESEHEVDMNFRRRGCTCIIVAHRLSTIRDADEILVLERGKVVQRGTHEELWNQEGLYAELIRKEGEAVIEEEPVYD